MLTLRNSELEIFGSPSRGAAIVSLAGVLEADMVLRRGKFSWAPFVRDFVMSVRAQVWGL